MSFNSRTFKILIASPSDLSDERKIAREAIHEWNDLYSEAEGVNLLPVLWETHVMPEAGDRPQGIINRQFADNCDLLIGLFWTRLGTSTGMAASGTVEEIERSIASGKPAMLYFSDRPVSPSKLDTEQMNRLKDFKSTIFKQAIAGSFASPDEQHPDESLQSQNGRFWRAPTWPVLGAR
jgi:hypothetical protein